MMNKVALYALGGAVLGYMRSRTKKGRPKAALVGAAVGYALAAQVAPRLGIALPAPRGMA